MQIINAHQNNLKNISLSIAQNQLIVLTGLSGSGKSSLAMDVIANEGYRYFLESLPGYNQLNAQLIPTADVDEITGLPAVVKVEQSKAFRSVNATFGTLSDLASIFRILFARYAGPKTMSKSLFSFNHPKGACQACNGLGQAEYIDLDKLIGDRNKTLREGAILTTLPTGYIVYSQITVQELDKVCKTHGFNVDIPWKDLTDEQQNVVLNGSDRIKVFYGKHTLESRLRWKGLKAKPREEGYYKGMLPIMNDILRRDRNQNILKFVSSSICPDCQGARIKPEHLKYKWKGLNFQKWMDLSLKELYDKFQKLEFLGGEQTLVNKISEQLIDFIKLGMGHYTLSSSSIDISSGDAQRIKLIRQLNSNLQGILYVFDEPSIGLARDYQTYLLYILKRLISRGNTVMVVEHDLNFIRAADWIIELGPDAGQSGGDIVFNGPITEFLKAQNLKSHTLDELQKPDVSLIKPDTSDSFEPDTGELTVISRKTPEMLQRVDEFCEKHDLNRQVVSDQPIGKTPRSNPATYTGLSDKIRDLLAKSPEAKTKGLGKAAFSFNNKIGRCETCEGAGVIALSMNVMGNINQVCPHCNGKRFKSEVLQVHWNGKDIAQIYGLSIKQAVAFFQTEKPIIKILTLMLQLGLGYIKLGQPSNTLSGGEAQRVKLTKHFAKQSKKTFLQLEEPSIGLHRHNIRELLKALHELKKQTSGIVCFEHHPLFQASCDTLIENAIKSPQVELSEIIDQPGDSISIRGARTHHLKDLNVKLPKYQLCVITGISGAGKSSLVMDTLHGFGLGEMTKQFSSYEQSRVGVNFQFDVKHIEGLTPTICISSKGTSFSPHSNIAKQTGIDKILRFAFSRKAQYQGKELSASHFSDNHQLGKCAVCQGVGQELLPDLDRIVRDKNKSIADGLFEHNKSLSYYGHPGSQYMAIAKEMGKSYGFGLQTPFMELSDRQIDVLLHGDDDTIWKAQWAFKTKTRQGKQDISMQWKGLFHYLQDEYYKTRKNKNIETLRSLFAPVKCSHCKGSGIKPERLVFKIGDKSIHQIKSMRFIDLDLWLANTDTMGEIDQKLLAAIEPHLSGTIKRAKQLHIDHLQLNRKSTTLSGGENQRIALIKQLNSPLKGITYLLDEPTAGLSNDNIGDLLGILRELLDKGNTVIVIEHNKEVVLWADHILQLGPKAGRLGGYLTFQGSPEQFLKQSVCHPFYKTPTKEIDLKVGTQAISIENLSRHSLIRQELKIPVGGITAISGRSGVGKTTLVKQILLPSINSGKPVYCERISFPAPYTEAHYFESTKLRSHRGTLLVSYLDLLLDITKIFAAQSKLRAKDFSYKTKSSQCSNCKGTARVETSLDIAANAIETCQECQGNRYRQELLEHRVNAKNIADVLAMNIMELKEWLEGNKVSAKTLALIAQLEEIGLAHLNLDQPVQSLSSGEKQRLLLLNWLQEQRKDALYILDEPSTGLHYADIDLLFGILKKLSASSDILVIDHNLYLLEKIGVGLVLE